MPSNSNGNLPLYTLIVAGGTAARFGADKMLSRLGDLPVFLHSVRAFLPVSTALVLVVPPGREDEFAATARDHALLSEKMTLVPGGATRTDSMRHGLQALPADANGLVAIHDAARPLATADLLLALAELAAQIGGAAPAKPVSDTLLRSDCQDLVLDAIPRDSLWTVETPQVFQLPALREACDALQGQSFTDDTQLFLRHGGHV